jgi:SAM-dependent methyltransferase
MPVDLEDLAAGYEHRPPSSAALRRAQRAAVSAELKPGAIAVDVGGGRGHHAAVWAALGAYAVVVDPSRGMTNAANRHPGVVPICGVAQRLPLRTEVAELAYFHLSIHYGDWMGAVGEVHRVLRPGAACWIWTLGAGHHRSSFLARWFPSVGDIDAARFPDPETIVSALAENWSEVEHGKEVEERSMPAADWRAAAQARFVSTLQLVPATEFAAGLAAFDAAYPDPEETVEYRLTFDWIRGRK